MTTMARACGEAALCLGCAAALVALDWAYLYRRYGYHKRDTQG